MNSQAGLDLAALRGIRGRHQDHTHQIDRIADHLNHHDGYLAFSGGKDSLVALHLTRRVDPAIPVVWFDSGLEFPETTAYIGDLAEQWALNLHVIHPRHQLLDLLKNSGTWTRAGATQLGTDLHHTLISEPSHRAHQIFGPGAILGVRAAESHIRALHFRNALAHAAPLGMPRDQARSAHGGTVTRTDGTVAFSPLWDWTTPQVYEYIAAQRLPINPVYKKLTALGVPEPEQRLTHVIDGSFLNRGRATWLRHGWPKIYSELVEALPLLADYA